MGGEVIQTQNLEDETIIEVLQRPLSRGTDRPREDKEGDGRFLVRYKTFKDPYVFSQGRELTVAGIVVETKTSKIDHKSYTYPVLENRETHLWPEREEIPPSYWYPYHPWPYPYYPWPYHWYYGPCRYY